MVFKMNYSIKTLYLYKFQSKIRNKAIEKYNIYVHSMWNKMANLKYNDSAIIFHENCKIK